MASRLLKIAAVYLLIGGLSLLALLAGYGGAKPLVVIGAAVAWLAVLAIIVNLLRPIRGSDNPGETDVFARQARAGFPAHIEEWR